MNYETLLYQEEGPVALVTLNRPERLNAINPRLTREFHQALDALEERPHLRVVVVTGAGRAFSAGADVKEWDEREGLPLRTRGTAADFCLRIEESPKVFIAAINGYALGGGLELALACDLRFASTTAQFGLPEVKLGILPGAGGTQRLPRLVGPGRAKELLLSGDFIDAPTALQWGLVNRVVEPERLLEEALHYARELAQRPPLSLQLIKSAVNTGLQTDLRSALEYEARCFYIVDRSEDRREGMQAFLEKRPPRFKGR